MTQEQYFALQQQKNEYHKFPIQGQVSYSRPLPSIVRLTPSSLNKMMINKLVSIAEMLVDSL